MKEPSKERSGLRRLLAAAAGVLGLVCATGLSSSALTDAQWTSGEHAQAVVDAGTAEPAENLRCSRTGFGNVANLVVSWDPPEAGLAAQGYMVELYAPGSSGSLVHQEILPADQQSFGDFEDYLSHSRSGNVLEARFSVLGPGEWHSEPWVVEVEASIWALILPRVSCDIEGPGYREGFSEQPPETSPPETLPPEDETAELPEEAPSETPDSSESHEESSQEEGQQEPIPPEETVPPEEDWEEPVEEVPSETSEPSETDEEPEEVEESGGPSTQ